MYAYGIVAQANNTLFLSPSSPCFHQYIVIWQSLIEAKGN